MKNPEWQYKAVLLANANVMSWREIAEYLDVAKSTVSDYLRKYYETLVAPPGFASLEAKTEESKYDNSRILIISDMHIPYNHKNLIPFLTMLKNRYEPTRVICVGDELDKHAMSFHDSDPDLPSAGDELARSLPVIQEVEALFPVMELIDSNHGSMVYRKAKHHGIPRRYIRSYNDVLGVGKGWTWHNDLIVPQQQFGKPPVYIHHGKSGDGIKLSQTMGMSCVQGHFHEKLNIQYWANPLALYFSLQVGCLIDDEGYAFSYNNTNLKRPLIGTGLIIEGIPVIEAMEL